ncbi:bifunctional (p)ppGpp synthetase/guanosine-3',5'-bis(diphosphate) 3'-pyrophosphohydrolase [Methanococcoides sp. SA1]|nr:bifunctional (p)ppGpp synthetase/guanosine-3',5'-bis(diphosphate) 3'-pyrophosphohydrolase [Methanococcoides sp. SA1]
MIKSELIERALGFAREKHEAQVRRCGEDYIGHPIRVAETVDEYYNGEDKELLKVVSLLHDVLENCDVTFEDLVGEFGEEVAALVLELTTYKDDYGSGGKVQHLSEKLSDVSRVSDLALVVKLADRLDNVSDLAERDVDWARGRRDETLVILDVAQEKRVLSEVHKKLIGAIRGKLNEVEI